MSNLARTLYEQIQGAGTNNNNDESRNLHIGARAVQFAEGLRAKKANGRLESRGECVTRLLLTLQKMLTVPAIVELMKEIDDETETESENDSMVA